MGRHFARVYRRSDDSDPGAFPRIRASTTSEEPIGTRRGGKTGVE